MGAWITNGAQYDSIIRCTFDLSAMTSSSSVTSNGIVFSASPTSATTAGENGSNIYIGYSRVLGNPNSIYSAYNALTIYGASGQNQNKNNVFEYNEFADFYVRGIYLYYTGENNIVRYNKIHRSNKTSVSTFYGIVTNYANGGTEIIGNRIYRPGGISGGTATGYGIQIEYAQNTTASKYILVANNAVYDFNVNLSYGLRIYNSAYTKAYHNTILNDYINASTTTTYLSYFYYTTGMEVKNNHFILTGGTQGTKYGMYFISGTPTTGQFAGNNIYVNTPTSGVLNYAYVSGNIFANQTALNNSYPTINPGGPSEDPGFMDAANGFLMPKNTTLLAPRLSEVTLDMDEVARESNTAIGAVEIGPVGNNNAGMIALLTTDDVYCPGTQTIKAVIYNAGNNTINNVQIGWSVNGVAQAPVTYTGTLVSMKASFGSNIDTVILGTANISNLNYTNVIAWTFAPNNANDPLKVNDTLENEFKASLSGTYTVNPGQATGGSNFQNFADLTTALKEGVCGPVVVNVTPAATFTEQIEFSDFPGVSAINTIRINGNGATVSFSGSSSNLANVIFNGAKYITIDSFNFVATHASYGWGAWITNGAEYDSIIRCTFDLSRHTYSITGYSGGIIFSTAQGSGATSGGDHGSNIYLGYNTIKGNPANQYSLGYGIAITGISGQDYNSGNVIEYNEIENFYSYGIRLYYTGDDNIVRYNKVHRSSKTVIGTNTSYAIQLGSMGAGTQIIGNRVYKPAGTVANNTTNFYGIYITSVTGTTAKPTMVVNNAVYDCNQNLAYGIYVSSSPYLKLLHNTVVNEHENNSTTINYGVYASFGANSEFKNNNIVLTGGSNTTKYGAYLLGTLPQASDIVGNNIYVNAANGSPNYAYYNGTVYATQADLNAAYPAVNMGAPSEDPVFVDPLNGDYTPGNPFLKTNSLSEVGDDINEYPRSNITAIGAFEIAPAGMNNAGMIAVLGPDNTFCAGSQQIRAVIYNAGKNNINSLQLNWSVNGTIQSSVSYSGTLVPMSIIGGKNVDTVILGNANITNTASANIKVWTTMPNGQTDPLHYNDTSDIELRASMSGTYTVNSGQATGGSNFRSFTDLTNSLNAYGVCGPVAVNVTNATYQEQLEIKEIKGASAVNTIRINGNGATVQHTTATSTNLPILILDGAKYVTVDNLKFTTTSAAYSWGALITGGAQYDSIINCEFDLSNMTASSVSYSNGIVFSASRTSPTTQGENGSDIYIGYNTIKGNPTNMYSVVHGIVMYGTNGQNHNANNIIEYNTIQDFYTNGVTFYGATNLTFRYNEIHKKNKTAITGTTYGMYLYYLGEGSQIIGNRIHTLGGTLTTPNTLTTYPIYCYYSQGTISNPVLIANNAVYNMNKMVVSGAHLYYNNNLKFYHNTINIDVPVTSTTTQQGIYAYTSSSAYTGLDIKNNIINITAGNTSTKYGIFYSSASNIGQSEMNNIYMNSSQSGTQNYINLGSVYATRAAYQSSSYASRYEINSPSVDPQYYNAAVGDFSPRNPALIGVGENLLSDVPLDIRGVGRDNPPTIGAFRKAPEGQDNAALLTILSPTLTSCAGTHSIDVVIMNAGSNDIDELKVNLSINGATPTVLNYNKTLVPLGNSGRSMDTITLGNVVLSATAQTNIKVWTSLPNGLQDSKTDNDTLEEDYRASMNGVYTINQNAAVSATNFQSVTAFTTALKNNGVCGPVVGEIVAGSGPYTETVEIGYIEGVSATNTIRLKGNGETVQFNNTLADRQLLILDSAYYVTIDSVTFKTLNATYGWGALITNASRFDSIIRSTFDLTSISGTATANSNGITFSGSKTSAITGGENGSDIYIGYNKVLGRTLSGGPYYAFTMYGNNESENSNNIIEYNEFSNYHYYGARTNYGANLKMRYNDFNRKTKTSVHSLFYGMYANFAQPNSEFIGNKIHDAAAPSVAGTAAGQGMYFINGRGTSAAPVAVANNLIYNLGVNMTSGIYLTSANYIRVYHNTIVNNTTKTTSTTANYGIYMTSSSTSEVKNNIISITGGGRGDIYGFFVSSMGSNHHYFQKNNVYINSTQPGNHYYAKYENTDYATLGDLQAVYPTLEDNSPSLDPNFVDVENGNLKPREIQLAGAGESLLSLVPLDIRGVNRSIDPTIGAVEVGPEGNNNASAYAFTSPVGIYCPDSQVVKLVVKNVGVNAITDLKVNWTVNNIPQPQASYSGFLQTPLSTLGRSEDTVVLGKVYFPANTNTEIKAWTLLPNGQSDPETWNDTIMASFKPETFSALAFMDTICPGMNAAVNLSPETGYSSQITWQSSTDNLNWIDIPNSDNVSLTDASFNQSKWYRAKLDSGQPCYSDVAKVEVLGVQPSIVQSDTACGPSVLHLSVDAIPGAQINWYESNLSQTAIDTGRNFTTPYLNASTTYWAQVSANLAPVSGAVGDGTSSTNSTFSPVYASYAQHKSQFIVLASELLDAGLTPGEISSVSFELTAASVTNDMKDFIVKVGPTSKTSVSGVWEGNLTTIYTNPTYKPTVGVNTFNASAPVYWDGQSNLILDFCFDAGTTTPGGSTSIKYHSTSYTSSHYTYTNGAANFCDNPSSSNYTTTNRPNLGFAIQNRCESERVPVYAIISSLPPTFDLGNDTAICAGESFVIKAGNTDPNASVKWNDLSVQDTLLVTNGGQYIATVVNEFGCSTSDTINVVQNPLPTNVNLGNDLVLCQGDAAVLSTGNTDPNATFVWNDNSNGRTLNVTTSGQYSVTVTSPDGCVAKDTINVTFNPSPAIVNLGNDTAFCQGNTLTLQSGVTDPNTSVLWSTGSTQRNLNVNTTGNYWVKITNQYNCITSDSIKVTVHNLPAVFDLGNDTGICVGESFVLEVGNTDVNATVLWSDNSTKDTLRVSQGGQYSVVVTNQHGCTYSDTINVTQYSLPAGVDLGKDTALCAGASYTLSTNNTDLSASFLWSNNTTGRTLTVNTTDEYSVTVTDVNGCVSRDTAKVTFNPIPVAFDLGNDTSICSGESFVLRVDNLDPTSTIEWSDQSTDDSLVVSQAGKYYVTVTQQGGCYSADTINVYEYSLPTGVDLGNDTVFCVGEAYTFSTNNTDLSANFLWSDNSSGRTLTVNTTGQYSVRVTDVNGCVADDTVLVVFHANPVAFNLGNDTGICVGESVLLEVGNVDPNASVVWNDNSTKDTLRINQTGKYFATVTNQYGCITSDSISLTIYQLPADVDLGNDTAFCIGDSYTLSTNNTDLSAAFLWSDNSSDRTLTVNTTGQYFVSVTDVNGCMSSDTVHVVFNANPSVINLGNDTAFCNDGSVLTLESGNLDPNTAVLWSTGSTSTDITVNTSGKYWVETTNLSGCVASDTIGVIVHDLPLSFNLGNDTNFCVGESVLLEVGNTDANVSVVWNDNSTQDTLRVSQAGQYFATKTNQFGCIASDTINIGLYQLPAGVDLGNDTAFCEGETYTLTTNNTDPNATFLWSDHSTGNTLTVSTSGQYSVSVTNVHGCVSSDTVDVVFNANPPAFDLGADTTICDGITWHLTTGITDPNVTFLWSDNSTDSTLDVAASGQYFVNVTNSFGCSTSDTINLIVDANLPQCNLGPDTAYYDYTCEGQDLHLYASGGATYSWTGPNGFTSNERDPIIPNVTMAAYGLYTVTIKDNKNQTFVRNMPVTILPKLNLITSSNSPVCAGNILNLQATGGMTYEWTGPDSFVSTTPSPMIGNVRAAASGTYRVITSNTYCFDTAYVQVVIDTLPYVEVSSNTPVCEDDTIKLQAGSGASSYLWVGPNGFTSNLQNPIIPNANSSHAGDYSITVSDGNGCSSDTKYLKVDINKKAIATMNANNPVCEGSDLTLEATGGSSYSWSGPNGFNSNNANPVLPNMTQNDSGFYAVIVTDSNGCHTQLDVFVDVNPKPTITASSNAPICAGNTLSLTANGGTSYSWTGPNGFSSTSSNPSIMNTSLAASGNYTVIVSDGQCIDSTTINVVITPGPAITASSNSPLCEDDNLNLNVVGATGLTYSWTGPNNFSSNQQNPSVNGVTTSDNGLYIVTATDAGQCVTIDTVDVVINEKPTPVASSNSPVCSGDTLTLHASGGATYTWTGPNGFTSSDAQPIIPNASSSANGVYTVVVANANCTDTAKVNVVINTSPNAMASYNNPVCEGYSINLEASGGTSYRWTGPNGFKAYTQNPIIYNANTNHSGVYNVTVVDNNGCRATDSVTVTVNTFTPAVAYANTPVCEGETLNLEATNGVSYSWTGPNGFTSNLQNPEINDVTMSSYGRFTVTVTDATGCESTTDVNVVVNMKPDLVVNYNGPVCEGQYLHLSVTGGMLHSWTGPNGFTSNQATPLVPNVTMLDSGIYTVVGSNTYCTDTAEINVIITPASSVTATSNGPVCEGETLQLIANGSAGMSYKWTGPNNFVSNQQNPVINSVNMSAAGIYTVTSFNSTSSCVSTDTVLVAVSAFNSATVTANSPICDGGTLKLQASSGDFYNWTGPNGFTSNLQNPEIANISQLHDGVYQVTVTNAIGCESTASINISVNSKPNTSILANTPLCEGSNLYFRATGGVSYNWTGPNGFSSQISTPSITNIDSNTSGIYYVSVIGNNGCTTFDSIDVTVYPNPKAIASVDAPICEGDTLKLASSGGSSFAWTGPNGFTSTLQNPIIPNATVSAYGQYKVVVTGVGGCTSEARVNAAVYNKPNLIVKTNEPCNGQVLYLQATGGMTYEWTGPNNYSATTPAPYIVNSSPLHSGTYYVTAKNNGLCESFDSVSVTVTPGPSVTASSNSPVIEGDTLKLTANSPTGFIYNWEGPARFLSATQNPTLYRVKANAGGIYIVTVKDAEGCIGRDTLNIAILPPGGPTPPMPNSTTGSTTAVTLQLFPNPAVNTVTLSAESEQPMETVVVYNQLGQIMYKGKAESFDKHTLNVRGYASGIYQVKIVMGDGTQIQRKFEIAR